MEKSLLGNKIKSYANFFDLSSLHVLKDFVQMAERWQDNSMPGEILQCECPLFPNALIIIKNRKTKTEYDKQTLVRIDLDGDQRERAEISGIPAHAQSDT